MRSKFAAMVAAAVAMTVAAAGGLVLWLDDAATQRRLQAEQSTVARLERNVSELQAAAAHAPDWTSVAGRVEPSVFTVEAGDSLGSAWVIRSDAQGSVLVTNYHVVADAWSSGASTVQVLHRDKTMQGTIYRVDPNDDLALIRVRQPLPALVPEIGRPHLGTTVMAVGSPLGLEGSVSLGIVAGYRSLAGSDYIQFSAPISPGNSGGPVVDETGRVIAVASAKLVGDGVEGLSLAIPVDVVCNAVAVCARP